MVAVGIHTVGIEAPKVAGTVSAHPVLGLVDMIDQHTGTAAHDGI